MIGRIILRTILLNVGFLPVDYLHKGFDLTRYCTFIKNRSLLKFLSMGGFSKKESLKQK